MRKLWFLLFFVVLVASGIGFWYFNTQVVETQFNTCSVYQSNVEKFMLAMSSGNIESCELVSGFLKDRCFAWLLKDVSFCHVDDLECFFVAKQDESLCPDITCKALIRNDVSLCESILDEESRLDCVAYVSFDASYYVPNEDVCKTSAEYFSRI